MARVQLLAVDPEGMEAVETGVVKEQFLLPGVVVTSTGEGVMAITKQTRR